MGRHLAQLSTEGKGTIARKSIAGSIIAALAASMIVALSATSAQATTSTHPPKDTCEVVTEYKWSKEVPGHAETYTTEKKYKRTTTVYTVEHKDTGLTNNASLNNRVISWYGSINAAAKPDTFWQLPDSIVNAAGINPFSVAQNGSVDLIFYGFPEHAVVPYRITSIESYTSPPSGSMFVANSNVTLYYTGSGIGSTKESDAVWTATNPGSSWASFGPSRQVSNNDYTPAKTVFYLPGGGQSDSNTDANWTTEKPGLPWTQVDTRTNGTTGDCAPAQDLTCDILVVDYKRPLKNGDHINLSYNTGSGADKQVNVYVDQNVPGGFTGTVNGTSVNQLGLRFSNGTTEGLTETEILSGKIVFEYRSFIQGNRVTVTFVQSNETDTWPNLKCTPELELAVAKVNITPATCDAGETLVYEDEYDPETGLYIDNASWEYADSTPNGTEGPANYSVKATADTDAAFSDDPEDTEKVITGTLQGPKTDGCTPPPTLQECETFDTVTFTSLEGWATSWTRAAGYNKFVADGLLVGTQYNATGSPDPRKAASYYPVNFDLKDLGAGSNASRIEYINLDSASFPYPPGGQLLVDFDGNPANNTLTLTTGNGVVISGDGLLVVEGVYGEDLWLGNESAQYIKDAAPLHSGGSGSSNHGTANQWLEQFPTAHVNAIGYSLGSSVNAKGIITALGAYNCTIYKPGLPQAPEPQEGRDVVRTPAVCGVDTVQQTVTNWWIDPVWDEDLQQWVPGSVEDKQYGDPVITTEKVTNEEVGDCPLVPGDIQAQCVSDVPWLDYNVDLPAGFVADSNNPLTVTFVNPNNPSESYVVSDLPLTGAIPWPGAADRSDPLKMATPKSWPGWITNADGTYTETSGNYRWTREGVQVTFDVNPHYEAKVTYPVSSAKCANPPKKVTELGHTGTDAGIPFGIALLLLITGGVALAVRRRKAA